MEIEPNTQIVLAKKLWKIVKILAFLLKNGITKSKLVLNLHMLLKRGVLAGRALRHLPVNCCSDDTVHSYVSARVYEFSCSSSPIYPSYHPLRHKSHNVKTIQKVFKYLDEIEVQNVSQGASPIFGSSPTVRQLRVTDSPFSPRDYNKENTNVDDAAQEFINKFYSDLNHQKTIAALQPPSPYYMWAS